MHKKTPWETAVDFHGHSCPGLAIGFRAAELAMEALGAKRAVDEELLAIVENNACGIDAVQTLAGCSFGKGNLLFKDLGKQVYTFVRRKDGSAVRVAVKYGSTFDQGYSDLKERVKSGAASMEDKAKYAEAMKKRIQNILNAGPEVFEVKKVNIKLPPAASIYETLQCAKCGEGVMEPRARLMSGQVVCLPCFARGEENAES
ncbi:FmdE family protein [Pelotomaculum propionicicum]|uniref:Formylmethanofuran dehydrogenase subunit E domain-containing protein n=1 Tax=Pelotomaculum propionicicum TaxID=258475 RepID=A0A4Y7RMF2_9FIRM|nr:FmdE family protein [Pelotomaculum propionicicum]NLI13688.1 formylmethanofuran dehydrogenase [Peptococcaceae bacterium]TEB10001.1 hypothetical protein Pmgp_02696 [Pelotomaculum propionicicum]